MRWSGNGTFPTGAGIRLEEGLADAAPSGFMGVPAITRERPQDNPGFQASEARHGSSDRY